VALAGVLYPLALFGFGGLTLAEVKGALKRPAKSEADTPPPIDLD
jgi:hypothetical protein